MIKQVKRMENRAAVTIYMAILLTFGIFGVDARNNSAFTLPLEYSDNVPPASSLAPVEIPFQEHSPVAVASPVTPAVPQRSHAPEPSTVFMFAAASRNLNGFLI
jgi:hypothetical protein